MGAHYRARARPRQPYRLHSKLYQNLSRGRNALSRLCIGHVLPTLPDVRGRCAARNGRYNWNVSRDTVFQNTVKLTTLIAVCTISSKFYVPMPDADACAVSPGITLARVCAVVDDIAVLVVTWRYMRPAIVIPGASQVDLPRANGNAIGSLANVLVQDGALILSCCVSAKPAQLRAV